MKKFLLSLVAGVVALAASAGGNGGTKTNYWFTINADVEAEATGAGKVYCSFESSDDAKAKQTTSASKHFSAAISGTNWSEAGQSIALYQEANPGYEFVEYQIDGKKINVTKGDYGDTYKITCTQANNCGAGELSEDECTAQHNENLAGVVTHIKAIFREVEQCWFYAAAKAEQVEGGTVSVSFDGASDVREEVISNATVLFSRNITPGDYSAVTRNLYIHVAANEGYALKSLTVNGTEMSVDQQGDVIYFTRMSAANKVADGSVSYDEAEAGLANAQLPAPIVVVAEFEKVLTPAVEFAVEGEFDEDAQAYVGEAKVTVTVKDVPEEVKTVYSVEDREETVSESPMLKDDVEWIALPEDGVVTLNKSSLLTVVVLDANEEEIVSNEIEVKVVSATTGINDVKVNDSKVYKTIENGQVIIVKDGARYNTVGQSIK